MSANTSLPTDITACSVAQLQSLLHHKKISPEIVVNAFYQRAKQYQYLNAFLDLNAPANNPNSSFDSPPNDNQPSFMGVPIAHKDIFCNRQTITTCGSKMLANYRSPFNATVIEKCNHAGFFNLGRTNMDEFAMGSSGEHSAIAPTLNPWDLNRVPGGSSSGSAVAVAARLVPVATATDTGGSIRQPAAFCGVSGIKPTYGRVSRFGLIAFASSFDQAGIIATTAYDCARALSVIASFDKRDSTSLPQKEEDFTTDLSQSIKNKIIGLPKQFFAQGLNNEVAKVINDAVRVLEKMGAKIVEVDLPTSQYAIAAYYVLTCAEASSNLSRYDGVRYGHQAPKCENIKQLYQQSRTQGFGSEVKRRILIGTYVLSYGYYDAYYRQAMKVRQLIVNDFNRAFEQCDLIAGPTTPDVAFPLNAITNQNPVAMYLQDIYTVPVNLAGLPAMSVPCGFVKKLPVGLQLIAPVNAESTLLSVAHQYQQQTDFHQQKPNLQPPPITV